MYQIELQVINTFILKGKSPLERCGANFSLQGGGDMVLLESTVTGSRVK